MNLLEAAEKCVRGVKKEGWGKGVLLFLENGEYDTMPWAIFRSKNPTTDFPWGRPKIIATVEMNDILRIINEFSEKRLSEDEEIVKVAEAWLLSRNPKS